MPTHFVPGLPFHAPSVAPTAELMRASGRSRWPADHGVEPATGDLWLVAVADVELGLAVVTEPGPHWAAVIPAWPARGVPRGGARIEPWGLLPALDVWPAHEVTIPSDLLTRRLGAATPRGTFPALLSADAGRLPDDLEEVWSRLNLGIDTGR
ncbi:hypothetical protein CHO01_39210 [Cellulomonas hominis]|uniref:Uncharacterized protein n=1 Tax=Cellulomonas hominis TaxID=156981 RepID=A0A511FHT4_9CELL|nr:hypothetical protein [Cellulomonas hominis]MBB5474797.1 hypothetical protein [Cellulomonas hominis]NKY05798.1 hypothetical protein [Cellulomonas hominis]GEL48805.1 hypothetical protein CHO01_39210 [Cellulomonas hominis]